MLKGNASFGLTAGGSYNAKYVTYVSVLANGVVEVGLKSSGRLGLGTAAGKHLTYTPTNKGGNLQWTVSGTVPTKYQPKT